MIRDIERIITLIYVLSKNGQPIMPTTNCRKVRLLLKSQKAKVVRRTPFMIQLLETNKTYVQPITLGVDAGSKHVGLSATTKKQELFTAELRPRDDVSKLLAVRKELRRARRHRTTRYRKPRYNNRSATRKSGWLPPSIRVKIWNHIQGIKYIIKLLPISTIRVETAEFSTAEMYIGMKSTKSKYNIHQYVLFRDNYTCRYCGKSQHDGVKFHVHHIESRQTGGNSPANLITLCVDCHHKYHAGKINLSKSRFGNPNKHSTFMGVMRKSLLNYLHNNIKGVLLQETYGYVTKYYRDLYKMPKTHINDAFVISGNFEASRLFKTMLMLPKRSHNRQIHKCKINKGGTRKLNQAPKFMFGYQLFDKVIYKNKECFIFGRRSSGSFDLRRLDGEKISAGTSYKKLNRILYRKSLLVDFN